MIIRDIFARVRKEDYIAHAFLLLVISFVVICALIPAIGKHRKNEYLPLNWFGLPEIDNMDTISPPRQTLFLIDETNIHLLVGNWKLQPLQHNASQFIITINNLNDNEKTVNIEVVLHVNKVDISTMMSGRVENDKIILSSSIKDPLTRRIFKNIYIVIIEDTIYLLPSIYVHWFQDRLDKNERLPMLFIRETPVPTQRMTNNSKTEGNAEIETK